MKHLKIVGLCLVSILAMGTALVENASASPLWLLCLEGSGLTKYSSNQCTEASSTGKWQSLGILSGSTDTVRFLGFSVRMEDTGAGVQIECPDGGIAGTAVGFIEGPNKGKITEVGSPEPEREGCKVLKGFLTCKAGALTNIKGVHLPWKTEIFETENKIFSKAENSGAGEPGWSITCGGATDECVSEGGLYEEAVLENVVSHGVLLVLGTTEKRRKQKCTIGGKETGVVAGYGAVLPWVGNGLSIRST